MYKLILEEKKMNIALIIILPLIAVALIMLPIIMAILRFRMTT